MSSNAVQLDPRQIAQSLGGTARGNQISAPAPGHSRKDRSLSVRIDPSAPEGFVVNGFAGEDPLGLRDYVRTKAGLPDWEPERRVNTAPTSHLRLVKVAEPPKPFTDHHLTRQGYAHAATYDYVDGSGEVLFEVLRYEHPTEPKTFTQRRPDGNGGWFAGRGDSVLYRLHDILANTVDPIFITEGEKDADRLASFGYLATTAPQGAWPNDLSALRGRKIFILADNDTMGEKKANAAVELLQGIATVARIDLPGLPEKGDVSDWLDAGHTQEELEALCIDAPPTPANDNVPEEGIDLPFVNPADWHGKPVPVREWFIEGLVPLRQVTILAGDGGVGKSLLALQLGAASALGCDTASLKLKAGRALYLGAEDEADEFHRRLFDIVRHQDRQLRDLEQFRLIPMADMDALLSIPDKAGVMQPTAVWHQFAEVARSFRPSLVVLDTVADLFGGDEIKRGQARQFIGMLRRLAIEIDAAVILLAHPSVEGMRSGTGSSGSTGWKNSSRSMLYFTRQEGKEDTDPDGRVLSTKKINYGKVGGELKLRWEAGVFVADGGQPTAAINLLNRKAETTFVDLLRLFTRTGQNVGVTPGTNFAPSKMAKHSASNGVSKKALEDAMQRLLERDAIKLVWEGPASRQRQRLIVSADDYGAKDGK